MTVEYRSQSQSETGDLLIRGARIVSPGFTLDDGVIVIRDGRIDQVLGPAEPAPDIAAAFDAGGRRVLPGFIDIHTHGVMGHDFMDGRPESWAAIARAKVLEGATSLCPTTLSAGEEALSQALASGEAYRDRPSFAKVLGAHVEGPFLNPRQAGAQNPRYLRAPDIRELERLATCGPVSVVTMAPELDGGSSFVREAVAMGLVVSVGHSAATHSEFLKAKDAGARHLTHFCNQMSPLHHREIGLVGSGFLDPDIKIELICDGFHLTPDMIRLVFQMVPVDRILLITDSTAASGLPDGSSLRLGELDVVVQDGTVRLRSGALAGSRLRYCEALRNVCRFTGLSVEAVVGTTSWNQAQSLGLEGLGQIQAGYRADLIVVDDDFEPVAVFVDGVERRREACSQIDG